MCLLLESLDHSRRFIKALEAHQAHRGISKAYYEVILMWIPGQVADFSGSIEHIWLFSIYLPRLLMDVENVGFLVAKLQ